MYTDIAEADLPNVRSDVKLPADFDTFWENSLEQARQHPIDLRARLQPSPLRTIQVQAVSFRGFAGDTVHGWLRTPAHAEGPLPTVVQYVGYGAGRGFAEDDLFWASAGFAHLVMDTRGQGSMWSPGVTADPHGSGPATPGFTTRGIESPETAYYRRVVVDAVRAVDAAAELTIVDSNRIATLGGSQGGYFALAAASLSPRVGAAFSFVPFMCDVARAITLTDDEPYREIARYLAFHRSSETTVLHTLSYLDGVNFARRSRAPIHFTAGLMDSVCPPSTVFAAHNAYQGPKSITTWRYNGHESGGIEDQLAAIGRLAELWD